MANADQDQLGAQYEAVIGRYSNFGSVAKTIVTGVLEDAGIRVHTVSFRPKSKSSALKKAALDGSVVSTIEDLHDLLGLRIVTYFADEVDAVGAVLEANFEADTLKSTDKRDLHDPDRFGYLSLHYVMALGADRTAFAEYAPYAGLRFEIQIRSILQHAWAEIEHDLGYKSPGVIPGALRRRFSRMAGLLELADEEFKSIRNEARDYSAEVASSLAKGGDAEIDQESVLALIENDSLVRALDEAIAVRYGVPLTDSTRLGAGARAGELSRIGYSSVSEIRDAIANRAAEIEAVAVEWLDRPSSQVPPHSIDGRYPDLARGIGLFYLFLIRRAEIDNEYELASYDEYDDGSETRDFIALCERARELLASEQGS